MISLRSSKVDANDYGIASWLVGGHDARVLLAKVDDDTRKVVEMKRTFESKGI